MTKTKNIYIQGMHCVSCEMLIKKSSETINGVKVESISASKGIMTVELADENALSEIHQCICDAGYKVLDAEPTATKKINLNHILLSILIVGVLATVFYKLDIVQYLPSVGDKLSIGVALLIGVVASLSTCLAIVGSIVIGFSEYGDAETGTKHHLRTQLLFQAGRIGGFFLLGGILGLVGQAVALSLTATTILTIIVGIVVLWMGLHLLGLAPNMTSAGLHLPKSRSQKTLTTKNPIFAPLIGMLTFFLPCGFTLSMQLIAINTGSFRQGGLAMAMFALGTAPVLFALGLGSSYIKDHGPEGKKFKLLHSIIGTLIVFFGIFMVMNGRRLLGSITADTSVNQNSNFTGEYERIELGHDGLNLIPEIVTLTAGKNYELVITPSSNGRACMVTMTIPGLDNSVNPIIKDKPIIYKFSNIKAGKYNVVCGTMGMYQGQIVVQ